MTGAEIEDRLPFASFQGRVLSFRARGFNQPTRVPSSIGEPVLDQIHHQFHLMGPQNVAHLDPVE